VVPVHRQAEVLPLIVHLRQAVQVRVIALLQEVTVLQLPAEVLQEVLQEVALAAAQEVVQAAVPAAVQVTEDN
jgi:hypothetical protein